MSVFSDVPYNFEGAGYIRLAATNGYMTAYSDGEFKPNNIVKNEEAITATIKLLGYTNQDFTGSYPYEQLSIARDIDLVDGIDTTIGRAITKKDLQRLIYNALLIHLAIRNRFPRRLYPLWYWLGLLRNSFYRRSTVQRSPRTSRCSSRYL